MWGDCDYEEEMRWMWGDCDYEEEMRWMWGDCDYEEEMRWMWGDCDYEEMRWMWGDCDYEEEIWKEKTKPNKPSAVTRGCGFFRNVFAVIKTTFCVTPFPCC
jgi:hypothetical protein